MKNSFPFIASSLGLLFMLVLIGTGATDPDTETMIPLLALMFISEFGFILVAAGTFFGYQSWRQERKTALLISTITCALLAIAFIWAGYTLWTGKVSI